MKKFIPSRPRSLREWGQTLALMMIALPAFVGAMGLAMDVGNFYYNYYKLQTAVDAAVLAGAHCLPSGNGCNGTCGPSSTTCTPSQTANYYATLSSNGVQTSEITGTTVGGGGTTITMNISRTVPYYFAKLVGLSQGTVNVTAEAQGGALGTAYNTFPIAIQYCGTPSSSSCYTQYTTYSLTHGSVAPGNWGPVSSSASSKVSLCPTGTGCLPVDTGCSSAKGAADNAQSLISQATSNPTYSGDTPSSFVAGDPRLVTVSLVDWGPTHGASTPLNVYGFAEFFLTGVVKGSGCSKGNPTISGQFITAVANGTTTSGSTADLGASAIKLIQ